MATMNNKDKTERGTTAAVDAAEETVKSITLYNPQRRDVLRRTAYTVGALPLALAACGGGGQSPGAGNSTGSNAGSNPGSNPNAGEPNSRVQPRGLHVSVLDDSRTTRGLCWFTDGLEDPGSIVEWAPADPDMSEADIQDVVNFPLANRTDGSSEPTTGLDNLTHKATIRDIPGDRAFRYRVGSQAGWSAVHLVQPTPPIDAPWSFVQFGDHGTTDRALMLNSEFTKAEYEHDLLLIAGDISYADGNQPVWDTWFDQNEPHLARHVLMCAPGNHENKDPDQDDEDFTTIPTFAFENRFHHPGDGTFYAFDYNRVHFFVFTAGALIENARLGQELATLEADLAQASARRAAGEIDFIFVVQHYTIWTDQEGRAPGNGSLIAAEEDILLRYGVDAVLCGHDHVYQRSVRMYRGSPDPSGLGYVQLMVGTGGHSIRRFEPTISEWSAEEFVGIGFARFEVDGGQVTVKYYGSPPVDMETREAATGEFTVVDEFVLNKRDPATAAQYAKPPRPQAQLLANLDEIEAHTRARNAWYAAGHHDHFRG